MIPEGRLEVLLEQALDTQIARCPFHNLALAGVSAAVAAGSVTAAAAGRGHIGGEGNGPAAPLAGLLHPSISLLSDYQAGVESLPTRCVQVGGWVGVLLWALLIASQPSCSDLIA